MIPAFVIGLREGVEAALIVGMVAAFLARSGRRDALRAVWGGVAIAVVLCLGVGLGLDALDRALPQRQQETLEAGIALLACGVVTAMILWMRRHARALRGELEEAAGRALASGSTTALVAMGALLAGLFGIQPSPTVAEALGWALYATPMLLIVSHVPRPQRRSAVEAKHA